MSRDCAVIGGGLAGAAVAASLARRGWRVTVFDAAPEPAAGASALPVGLLAPHYSADDNLLSRLTRAGVDLTLDEARTRLTEGVDWSPTGALQHRIGDRAPRVIDPSLQPWYRPATVEQKLAAGLDPGANALWHEKAAWIRPAALVRSWLGESGVAWQGGKRATKVRREGERWQVLDDGDRVIGDGHVVVLAAAHGSDALSGGRLALHQVRGQVSWGQQDSSLRFPAFPVNGNGHFVPQVPWAGGAAWFSGSTYQRDDADPAPRAADHASNLERLQSLLPDVARQLASVFHGAQVQSWSGVRCASPDRRPLVGEIEPGLWVSTAMGSRGLTFSALCAEIIAARLHGESPPVEPPLASALDVARLAPRRA